MSLIQGQCFNGLVTHSSEGSLECNLDAPNPDFASLPHCDRAVCMSDGTKGAGSMNLFVKGLLSDKATIHLHCSSVHIHAHLFQPLVCVYFCAFSFTLICSYLYTEPIGFFFICTHLSHSPAHLLLFVHIHLFMVTSTHLHSFILTGTHLLSFVLVCACQHLFVLIYAHLLILVSSHSFLLVLAHCCQVSLVLIGSHLFALVLIGYVFVLVHIVF